MIINRFNERARWFRCKDGTAAMVVNYGAYFRIMFNREVSGLVNNEWGTDACIITSDIGPVEWPEKEEPPLDLSGWEADVEHLVECRDGRRAVAYASSHEPYIYIKSRGIYTSLDGRPPSNGLLKSCHDIIHDYGPLDSLEIGEGK